MRKLIALVALLALGCNSAGSLVLMKINAEPEIAGIASLNVDATLLSGGASRNYDRPSPAPTTPIAVALQLQPDAHGPISMRVALLDANGVQLAVANGATMIVPGGTAEIDVTIITAPPDMTALDGPTDLALADAPPPDLAADAALDMAQLDGPPPDLVMPDLAMPDLTPPPDLTSPPDLTPQPDLATCALAAGATAWVDPALGSNDAQHGGAPGACAYRTLTYALMHASSTINLKSSATYQTAETFPLVLTGRQGINGDPTATGTQAHIVGLGASGSNYGAVFLMGSANKLLNLDVSTVGAAPGNSNACVVVASSGAHVVDRSTVHDCGAGVYSIGVNGNNTSGSTVSNSTIANVQNCVNSLGSNWTINATACSSTGYYVSICGAGLVGCGNTNAAGGMGLAVSCTVPANFTNTTCP